MKKVWCVEHSNGFCATKNNQKPSNEIDNVHTLCEHVVIMPWGYKYRKPDCVECLERLNKWSKPSRRLSE